MAYNIVKHRRGTTKEWFELDLVPESGELVIEECLSGERKCKIGDGIRRFSQLSYIDDAVQTRLLAEINNVKQEFSAAMERAEDNVDVLVSATKQELLSTMAENDANLKDFVTSSVATSAASTKADINTTVKALSTGFSEELSKVDIKLDQKVSVLAEELQTAFSTLEEQISQSTEQTGATLQESIEASSSLLDTKLEAETAARKAQDTILAQSIVSVANTIEEHIHPTIKAVDEKHAEAISTLEVKHEKTTSQLATDLETKTAELAEQMRANLKNQSEALSTVAATLVSDYEHKIQDAEKTVNKEIKALELKQDSSVKNLQTTLEQSMLDTAVVWAENLKQLKTDLVSADATLTKAISELEANGTAVSKELAAQLATLHEKVAKLSDVDLATAKDVDKKVEDLQKTDEELIVNLERLDEKHLGNYASLVKELAHIEESSRVADTIITDTLLAALTKVYVELADLVDDDIMIINKVFAVENTTRDNLTNLEATLSSNINNVYTSLNDRLTSFESQSADALESANTQFSAELQKLRESLTSMITSVDSFAKAQMADTASTVNTLSESLRTLDTTTAARFEYTDSVIEKNKTKANQAVKDAKKALEAQIATVDTHVESVNEKIDVQATRITNLIGMLDGKTAQDGELTDIRVGYNGKYYEKAGEAVRAVGDDVRNLRDSLAQYIDTQAIDGLRYDYDGEVGTMQPYMLYLTAGGEVIEESGVQILSGGGGGGSNTSSSLKLGYITDSPLVVTTSDKAILKFSFSGTDSSGDVIQQANATWKVNSVIVEYGTVKDGENEFDVTKYLNIGTTKVLLVVTDDNGSVVTKTWSVQQLELAVTSDFNDKKNYDADKELIFTYTPKGAVEKTAYFKLDGKDLGNVVLGADVSGTEVKYRIPPQTHGSHLLEIYLKAYINGIPIESNPKLVKDLIFYDNTCPKPVIGVSAAGLAIKSFLGVSVPTLTTKQYSPVSIAYTVYDPEAEEPSVEIFVDGELKTRTTVSPNLNYNNAPTGVFSYMETATGTHEVKFVCRGEEKIVKVEVEDIGVNIAPTTAGLVFDFNPHGRSNGDEDRLWSQGDIHMSTSSDFDWTNGGYIVDGSDGPCFCIKAGSTATIDYPLFADDAKENGKEFKLVFKTKNVANPDAVFLSCLDGATDAADTHKQIGISMGVHEATISCKGGDAGSLKLPYSEEDVIEFEFNIAKYSDNGVPMIIGYEDGVPSRPFLYTSSNSFKQDQAQVITIGSPDCDVYIYRFKVYNTALTDSEILNNFIADARTPEEMMARYNRNQIYDENHELDPDVLAKKCPWLRVYKVSAPVFTNDKDNKVQETTIQQIYVDGDPALDNWICYNAQHSGQGTSSNNYGPAGRNLDFIMNASGIEGVEPYFVLGDGSTSKEITLTRKSVPTAYLNAKVNIASSNNLTNAILAARYNQFNPYRRPFVEREGVNTDYIKDTMEFYNCVIFIQETDATIANHREFADNNWHFYAMGNIGDSKKTDKSRTTDPNDAYECCLEIMDIKLPLSDFPRDTMMNAMGFTTDASGNKTYTWAKPENLDILYTLENGRYVPATATEFSLENTYYVDILEHDDFSEKYTYGWRYLKNKKDTEAKEFCKRKWIEFYRFVTTTSDTYFKEHLKDYFVEDSALYYYLFTTRYCMVDNRAKNTFWHYGKTGGKYAEDITITNDDGVVIFSAKAGDDIRKWDFCWDYDNDTSLGLNNYGEQVYRYGLEDFDTDEAGTEVFRESDSTFFCRIRDLFATELAALYKALEDKGAWDAKNLITLCDNWQKEFPEELWRIDVVRKYIRPCTSTFINGEPRTDFLKVMCNGRMKYHRRQWERDQEQYMASKFLTTRASSDSYHANFRFGTPSTDTPAVPANYALTLTPFSYMYLTVAYSNAVSTVRAVPNVPVTVPYVPGASTDIVNVYCASAIRDFGDLSHSYPKTVSISNAKRVKKLTLGNSTPGYDNKALTSLTTTANPLLEELNVENISGLSGDAGTLSLNKLINLKKLNAKGTSITSVDFAQGGKIQEAKLPALNSIILKQLKYLSTDNIELSDYRNVTDLFIDECPLINQYTLFNRCPNLTKVRLTNVDFGTIDYSDFASKVLHLKGIPVNNGDEALPNAALKGTARFKYLTGAQFNDLTERYKDLAISYNTLTSTLTFKGTDGDTTVFTSTSTNGADCQNPVCYDDVETPPSGMIAKPVKESTDAFAYVFLGWSTEEGVVVSVEDPSYELTDEIRRSFREDAVKHVEGDRTVYPVFEAVRRTYPITFLNPAAKESDRVMQVVDVPYGSYAVYTGSEPRKENAASPDLYSFTGWYPDPDTKVVEGAFTCEAQFEAKDQDRMVDGEDHIDDGDTLPGYTLGWLDISNIVDSNGNVSNGYTLGYDSREQINTLTITNCGNKYNSAIRIPEYFELEDKKYYVTSIGGFTGHSDLELVFIPNTVKMIRESCFNGCYSLFEITIPESVTTIGMNAFKSCNTLTDLHIPLSVTSIGDGAFNSCRSLTNLTVAEGHSRYTIDNERYKCLIDKTNKKLIQGMSDSVIPLDGSVTSLGDYCFTNTNIQSVQIPELVTTIPAHAFSWCGQLSSVKFPSTLRTLGATCFAWCYELKEVTLPQNLTTITTFVFNSCPIETVTIPENVNEIGDRSFALNSALKNVYFKTKLKGNSDEMPIAIHARAFEGSGSEPVTFYVPWSETAQPPSGSPGAGLAPWGAHPNSRVVYNWNGGNTE